MNSTYRFSEQLDYNNDKNSSRGNKCKIFYSSVTMETINAAWNLTTRSIYMTHPYHRTSIASDYQREITAVVIYVALCGFISLFGTISNVINLIIFYKQGLNITINISFFALAVSDLSSLLLQMLFNFYINPLSEDLYLPIAYTDVQYLTGGAPREAFARITCLITVYITAERCLCIAVPLHVKQMITPKRTVTVICLIYVLTFVTFIPLYSTTYLDWKMFPNINKTLLSIVVTGDYEAGQDSLCFIHGISGVLSFIAVIIFTAILIQKLREKSTWRETANAQQHRYVSLSHRDMKTISMVVLISSILIVSYTPAVFLSVTTFLEPEFSVGGRYYNLCYILWSFGLLFENVNSSVNIFLYFKMSTKYRQSFHEIFDKSKSIIDSKSWTDNLS